MKQIKDDLDGNYLVVGATVSECNKMEASVATPQYGFNKKLKLFGKEAYDATEGIIGKPFGQESSQNGREPNKKDA